MTRGTLDISYDPNDPRFQTASSAEQAARIQAVAAEREAAARNALEQSKDSGVALPSQQDLDAQREHRTIEARKESLALKAAEEKTRRSYGQTAQEEAVSRDLAAEDEAIRLGRERRARRAAALEVLDGVLGPKESMQHKGIMDTAGEYYEKFRQLAAGLIEKDIDLMSSKLEEPEEASRLSKYMADAMAEVKKLQLSKPKKEILKWYQKINPLRWFRK